MHSHLSLLEITPWQTREQLCNSHSNDWDNLVKCVNNCTLCPLHTSRTQTVFGVGKQNAELMIIGEAPGFNEDKQGEPFVGRAGQLLNAMLTTINLQRENIFITNVLKCRPPENRDPKTAEVVSCTPYLQQQIALVKPKLLVAVGRIAAQYLLATKNSLESMRQTVHRYQHLDLPLIVTYHPAYLLRNPIDKKKSWLDLQFIQSYLNQH